MGKKILSILGLGIVLIGIAFCHAHLRDSCHRDLYYGGHHDVGTGRTRWRADRQSDPVAARHAAGQHRGVGGDYGADAGL